MTSWKCTTRAVKNEKGEKNMDGYSKIITFAFVIMLVISLIGLITMSNKAESSKTDETETYYTDITDRTAPVVQTVTEEDVPEVYEVIYTEELHTPVPVAAAVGGVVEEADPTEVPTKEPTAKPTKKPFKTIDNCPWSKKTQKAIAKICEGYGIKFEIVMSLAVRESDFREGLVGDGGRAHGAFQIHYREWKTLMDKLGYTLDDMYDPVKQADACCAILEGHYLECNNTNYALMAYNGGSAYAKRMMAAGRVSSYADEIKGRAERWKER